MTSSPPAYLLAIFVHSVCRNSSCSSTAGNCVGVELRARGRRPRPPPRRAGRRSPPGRRSCGRRWPGRCPARAPPTGPARRPCPRSGTARPTATRSAGRSAARGRPAAHFAGDGLSAPTRKRPSGSNLPLRYCLTTGSHRSRTSWRHRPSSGSVGLVGQQHRAGLLEQVGLRAVDGRGCRRRRPASSSGRCPGWTAARATSTSCRAAGAGRAANDPSTGTWAPANGVEQRDDEHRQRAGQHAGGEPAWRGELRRAGRGRGPRGGPSKRGAVTGDPADRRWGAVRWSMSTVIMPLPIATPCRAPVVSRRPVGGVL